MIHRFPTGTPADIPEKFTNPFRYTPHRLVSLAAGITISGIESDAETHKAFSEGKMLGVLIIRDRNGETGFLAGFSGNIGGRSTIPGFVPPIYDLTDPDGIFKKGERELDSLTAAIRELENSGRLALLKEELSTALTRMESTVSEMKTMIAISKRERDEIRNETQDPSRLQSLIRESQYQKAELRRIKERGLAEVNEINRRLQDIQDEISRIKLIRSQKSEKLQKWIFEQYVVSDAYGNRKTIGTIFADSGLVPPGGTGECAAPKLLQYAYESGLHPLAMGEFWYGKSPETAVRTHGHFYPSCTAKCGPLLSFMMNGLETIHLSDHCDYGEPETVYEDNDILVVEKPSGMPSVPGLDGKKSLLEHLKDKYGSCMVVHRLDMDTSGIMLFARNPEASAKLQKQFEEHSVNKIYKAKLCGDGNPHLKPGDKGKIELPLSPDYDERPRQKVDRSQGKESVTSYEVLSVNKDSTIDILFRPETGRTHQLRVHSAHIEGLGQPILGDMLYGGCTDAYTDSPQRLHLHAFSISFVHPVTGESMSFSSARLIY